VSYSFDVAGENLYNASALLLFEKAGRDEKNDVLC
jgi:hypothetical protein